MLADFTNTTGDTVFDGTLRQGMAVQLEQSPFLSLISEQRIQQTLKLMGESADARLIPEIAREVCERTQAPPSSMARSQALEASTYWGYAQRTVAQGTSSMKSKCKWQEKKTY